VDNEVLISKADHFVRIGDFVNVRIDSASHYDLFATPITQS